MISAWAILMLSLFSFKYENVAAFIQSESLCSEKSVLKSSKGLKTFDSLLENGLAKNPVLYEYILEILAKIVSVPVLTST